MNRPASITLRVSESEKQAILSCAAAHGLSVSDWIRQAATGWAPASSQGADLEDIERRLSRLEEMAGL